MIDGKPCVLCVDDFDAAGIAQLLVRSFAGKLTVLEASTIGEARKVWGKHRDEIDVAVLDVFVPDNAAAGLDLGRELGLEVPIIFISGHPREEFAARAQGLVPHAFIEKGPDWRPRLIEAIQSALVLPKESEEAVAEREYARQRTYSFGHTPGTVATVRFHLHELPEGQRQSPVDLHWDLGPLCLGVRHLELCVNHHHGRILHCTGLSAWAMFPAVAAEPDHFSQAIRALAGAHAAIAQHRGSGIDVPWFSAGIVAGTVVTGLLGEQNPGHAAVIGRLADVADQIALAAGPREVGAVESWIAAGDYAAIGQFGKTRLTPVSIRGAVGNVSLLIVTL